MESQQLMRDVFIDEIYDAIKLGNDNLYFFNADLGSQALDKWFDDSEARSHLVMTGISEQNAVNLSTGFALRGKVPYVYAMAPFLFARPFEQIKIASAMNVPINIVGVGVGYSYEGDGPTHYATEDVACIRALPNVEIITPCDTNSVKKTARLSYEKPGLRYIRLDRKYLPNVYEADDDVMVKDGLVEIHEGVDICLIATGVMVHSALELKMLLNNEGVSVGVVDVYRTNPFNTSRFVEIISKYKSLVTLEEHFRAGGLGELIAGIMALSGISKPIEIVAIDDKDNGRSGKYLLEGWVTRKDLHVLAQIDSETVLKKIRSNLT